MIETLEITINNKKYNYSKDITLQEIYMEHQGDFRFPIILAKVNNRLKELSATLTESATVEFIDLTTSEGNRAHLNGLIFVLQYAVKKLFGKNSDILVQHSLDKGLYIHTNFKLSEEKLLKIKEVMIDIITKDLPITKVTIDRIEAINYFKEIGDFTKAGVLRYNTNN